MKIIFIWEPGTLGHYWEKLRTAIKRLLRSKIFDEIERDNGKGVLLLANSKVLKNSRDEYGRSPLSASIGSNRSKIACDIIDCGGYHFGNGVVASAVMSNDLLVLNKLIEVGADINEPLQGLYSNNGWTPLMWATNRHYFEAMKLLLLAGAEIDAVAEDGTTAIMCTRNGKDDDLVALEILLSYKPNLNIKDWRGRTFIDEARDRARFSNKTAMRDMLLRYYPDLVIE